MGISSFPLGPSTLIVWPAMVAFTPLSNVTGCLPMRDMRLPHPQENFAADFLAPRLAPGHHPKRSRNYFDTHATRDLSELRGAAITADAGAADAFDSFHHRLTQS